MSAFLHRTANNTRMSIPYDLHIESNGRNILALGDLLQSLEFVSSSKNDEPIVADGELRAERLIIEVTANIEALLSDNIKQAFRSRDTIRQVFIDLLG